MSPVSIAAWVRFCERAHWGKNRVYGVWCYMYVCWYDPLGPRGELEIGGLSDWPLTHSTAETGTAGASLYYKLSISRVPGWWGHNEWSISDTRSSRYTVPGGRSKEDDGGIRCATRGRNSWPNLMVEVWFSESIRMLRLDAQWWFLASGGVNQISKLRITRSSSHPNVPTMTFSVWYWCGKAYEL